MIENAVEVVLERMAVEAEVMQLVVRGECLVILVLELEIETEIVIVTGIDIPLAKIAIVTNELVVHLVAVVCRVIRLEEGNVHVVLV